MAIITISRQVAALGDEIGEALAARLGYKFITRKELEKNIVALGFDEKKLCKYDERKPGFFASLVKDRDEYFYYLVTAVLEAAAGEDGNSFQNCILIGRGAENILAGLPNLLSIRFVSDTQTRLRRLEEKKEWTEKQAWQRINESDNNRRGFHKSFFNVDIDDPVNYMLTINTGIFDTDGASRSIVEFLRNYITEDKELAGREQLKSLLRCQHLVNALIFEHKLNIEFLRAVIEDDKLVLQGVADSSVLVERAVKIAAVEFPELTVTSNISVVQDYKAHL